MTSGINIVVDAMSDENNHHREWSDEDIGNRAMSIGSELGTETDSALLLTSGICVHGIHCVRHDPNGMIHVIFEVIAPLDADPDEHFSLAEFNEPETDPHGVNRNAAPSSEGSDLDAMFVRS